MNGVVSVFTALERPISIDEIRQRMRDRGTPVEWRPSPLTGGLGTSAWSSGRLVLEGEPEVQVLASREALDTASEDLEQDYGSDLTPAQRPAFEVARTRYALEADGGKAADRLLVQLADVITDLGSGLVHSGGAERFYDRTEFRAEHAHLLGGA